MADNEQIGGVSIGITGDYSSLVSDFARAQQVAAQAGQGIASALDVAMARADGLSSSITGVASSATSASAPVEQFDSWIAKLNQDIEQTFGADKAITAIGDGAAKAAPELENLGSDLNNVKKASHDLGEEGVHDQEKIDAAIKTSRQEFKQFTQDLKTGEAQMQQLGQSVQSGISNPLQFAKTQLTNFAGEMGMAGVVALGAAAGIAAVGYAAFTLVKDAGAAAEATGNLADRLNLTFTQTRQLEEMAQIAGVSVNGLQMASFRLAEALADASGQGKKVAEALTAVGVTGKSSGELLTGFLQKLAEIPDDTKRIALAHEVMGRSSQQILPLIKNYGELQAAVRALGNSLDEDGAKKLQKVDDEVDKLGISWNRLKEALAVKLTPVIEFVVKGAADALSTPIAKNAGAMQFMFGSFAPQLKEAAVALHGASADYGKSAEELKGAAVAWQSAHAKTLEGMKSTLTETTAQIRKLGSELGSTINPLGEDQRKAKETEYQALLVKESGLHDAIKAATEKQHDFAVKAIKYQTTGAEVLSALLADEANRHKTVAAEIAKVILAYQNLTGATLTPMQVLARETEAAKAAMKDLADNGAEGAPILKSVGDIAIDTGKALESVGVGAQMAADSSAWSRLDELMGKLGLQSKHVAEDAYKAALAIANEIEASRAAGVADAADVTAASVKVAELHKKLQEMITGTSLKASESVNKSAKEGEQAARRMFDSLERDLAKDIVQWKGFADTIKSIFQTLAQDLLQITFKILLKPMEDGLAKILKGVFSGGGLASVFGGGVSQVTGALPEGTGGSIAGLIPIVAANTTATAADTVSTTANTAGDAVNTGATIADAAATAVNAGATVANAIATTANTAATVASTATEVTSTISYLTSETANTVATTANTGVLAANTGAVAALTGAVAAATGVSAASGAVGAAGGIASGIAGAAGAGVSGIVGMVSGVVSAISSVIGNFQMAGMNKSLDLIVHHTLQCANDLANLRVDQWARHMGLLVKLDDIWGAIRDIGHVSGNSGGGSLISFTNTTFNGGASQADADRIGQSIVTQLQRAGAIR